jgi:hypothetical protein
VFDGFVLMRVELADATCLKSRPQSAIERFRKSDVLGSDGSETSNRRDVQIRSVWTICKAIGNESFERRIERAVTSHPRGQSVSRGRSVAHRVGMVPVESGAIKRRRYLKEHRFLVLGAACWQR